MEERGGAPGLQIIFRPAWAALRLSGRSIVEVVDTASSQPAELTLALPSAPAAGAVSAAGIPSELLGELWQTAEAASCDLTREELAQALAAVGAKHNFNQPPGTHADAAQKAGFWRSLRLPELALAQACALGKDAAWQRFLALYRTPLTQAAMAITGSATRGHDLADSLYAELFGLAERNGERRSPLASYSGRGSLLGWLRTTLAQRHVDHHRRTHRETPLDAQDVAAPTPALPIEVTQLSVAVARTLAALGAEDRFLLSTYYLDQQTLQSIGRLLRLHEATISRRLKRLTNDLRKQLLRTLQAGGLSRRAAEEALGADPRDLELNLRSLLQTSATQPFSQQAT
jgi:RNA polymerase sigma-70 factor (ECF subfamily)